MSEQQATQPPLPFEPALQLVEPGHSAEPEREVPLADFTSLLFGEFLRRAAALGDREPRPRA